MMRHKWTDTPNAGWVVDTKVRKGHRIQRCAHCDTERVRDPATKSLFLYRGGRATINGKPLGGIWSAFKAGVIPRCVDK